MMGCEFRAKSTQPLEQMVSSLGVRHNLIKSEMFHLNSDIICRSMTEQWKVHVQTYHLGPSVPLGP